MEVSRKAISSDCRLAAFMWIIDRWWSFCATGHVRSSIFLATRRDRELTRKPFKKLRDVNSVPSVVFTGSKNFSELAARSASKRLLVKAPVFDPDPKWPTEFALWLEKCEPQEHENWAFYLGIVLGSTRFRSRNRKWTFRLRGQWSPRFLN